MIQTVKSVFSDTMPNLQTRRRTGHFCLGQPAPLPSTCLPTEADIYNAAVYTRQQMEIKSNNFNRALISKHVVNKKVADEVISPWKNKGNLPTVQE